MEGRGDVRDGARRGATARAGIGARARTRRDVRRDAVLRGARAAHARRLAKTTRDGPKWERRAPRRASWVENAPPAAWSPPPGAAPTSWSCSRRRWEDRGCEAIEAPRPDPRHRRRGGRRRPRRCPPPRTRSRRRNPPARPPPRTRSRTHLRPLASSRVRARDGSVRGRAGGSARRRCAARGGERRESEALVTRGASRSTPRAKRSYDRNRGRDGSTL